MTPTGMPPESGRNDPTLAEALADAALRYARGEEGSDIPLAEAESAILERLEIDGDETEQGLTRRAVERIEVFVSDACGRPWTYQDSGLLGVDGTTR